MSPGAEEHGDTGPAPTPAGKAARGALQVAGGAVPLLGGLLSALAGAWSEHEQAKMNEFLREWVRMLEEELREQASTIREVVERLNLHDDRIGERVRSREFQSLVRKAIRDWSGGESEQKRILVRNILFTAAASRLASDDVVRLFLDWIRDYSVMHFDVIGAIYNTRGISRGEIWRRIGKGVVREDSAEADLFKLLIRDLSTGGIIRQHRETDGRGTFIAKQRGRQAEHSSGTLKSAFDENEPYVLTELGEQFVHYALSDLTTKIDYDASSTPGRATEAGS